MSGETVNYYADSSQADKLSRISNKSEFVREAVADALSDMEETTLGEINAAIDDIDDQLQELEREREDLLQKLEEIEAVTGDNN